MTLDPPLGDDVSEWGRVFRAWQRAGEPVDGLVWELKELLLAELLERRGIKPSNY